MRFEQLVELIERTHYELHSRAARSVNAALVVRNWLFGWRVNQNCRMFRRAGSQ